MSIESIGLRVPREFGVRTSPKRMPYKKYIFVYEGEKTESLYFEGLFNAREQLGIQSLIDFIPLERLDGTRSNQREVVVKTQAFLDKILILQKSKESLEQEIISYLLGEFNLEIIKDLIEEYIHFQNLEQEIQSFVEALDELNQESKELENIISQIKGLQKMINYKPGYDEVCIILDRDFKSFKENQYDEVLEICKKKKYKLGLTNPCFEFWLLLHFDDCLSRDIETIRKNPKINKKKRYLEIELAKLENLSGYNKNRLNFDDYIDQIPLAIQREKAFCQDLEKLKNHVGSTVGCIIEELMG